LAPPSGGYGPDTSRFITEAWPDYTRPQSLNGWNYAFANPINMVDPTGHYGREVHYEVTLRLARQVSRSSCHNSQACVAADVVAQLIAQGNFHMDERPLAAFPPPFGYPELHFTDQPTARRNARAAVGLSEPYLMGAALHQVQDWYSHAKEGYQWPGTLGHLWSSVRAGCTGSGPCHRDPALIRAFYEEYRRDTVEAKLAELYPSVNLSTISDDKLIDLYLQEFTRPGDTERSIIGYGYDTDYFFGFTRRDQDMVRETEFWVRTFFTGLDRCTAERLITGYTQPSDTEIVNFLRSGEFQPDTPPGLPELAP
jgi:hypothetical protein